jgi:hypothetical protein
MNATNPVEQVRDDFVGELTEAALRTVARYRPHGGSVDQELGVWRALGDAVRRLPPWARCDEVMAELASAAYRVALDSGFDGSFVDLELSLWRSLRRAARTAPQASAFFRSLRTAAVN